MPSLFDIRDFIFGNDDEVATSLEMLAEEKSKDLTCSTGKDEFIPYTSSVVSKALLDYAAQFLNETPETRERGLTELRQFAKDELNMPVTKEDDIYILCYLRSRKFDIKRTMSLMKRGLEFLESNLQLIERFDSDVVRRSMESRIIGFLPYRDAKERALVLIRAENWNPDTLKAEDIIYGSIVTLLTAADNPVNQIAGFVAILDLKNLRIQHLIALSNWLIFGIQALQRCCPCLVKEIHLINTPSFFRGMWKVAKPFISEKVRRRINFYKPADWDHLHQKIPPEILPSELEGKLGPFSNDHWAKDLSAIEHNYYMKVKRFLERNTSS